MRITKKLIEANSVDNKLYLSHNNISKIENLDNLSSLKFIHLSYNNIGKIENLENLVNLKRLFIFNNPVKTISKSSYDFWKKNGVKINFWLNVDDYLRISSIKVEDYHVEKLKFLLDIWD